jgi:cysteinyl-tRNA synthetase
MAKSEGNFVTVRDVLQEWTGEVIRFALLSTHYRDPLDWTEQKLQQALASLDRFYAALASRQTPTVVSEVRKGEDANPIVAIREDDQNTPSQISAGTAFLQKGKEEIPIINHLEDDLNTSSAIAKMHEITTEINSTDDGVRHFGLKADLKRCGDLMGVLQHDPLRWRHGRFLVFSDTAMIGGHGTILGSASKENEGKIQARIADRAQARKERRFTDADRIRTELAAEGIILEDRSDGSTDWRRA